MAPRNAYVHITRLHDVAGRINYVTNPDCQERLYGVYKTTNNRFWKILPAECRQEFMFLNHSGICVEAKEVVISLPDLFFGFKFKKGFERDDRCIQGPISC